MSIYSFPLVVLIHCCFHFLILKMNNFQAVMVPANILKIILLNCMTVLYSFQSTFTL